MELHKALKEIIANKGKDMINNALVINYLLDYQAFKEKPATKLILRDIINSGYSEEILSLNVNQGDWQIKFEKFKHEFIDSCGYKEDLTSYVFDAIAYSLGLETTNEEPTIKAPFNVDSFFDIPEVENKQTSAPQQTQAPAPTDLYTIALSFYTEGKYQQAKGFIEKALVQYHSSDMPSLYLKLMGDVQMKLGYFQEAIKYYNECFVRKAFEEQMTSSKLQMSLKKHEIKGFENSMFNYFFCMYYAKGMNDTQWLQFVKDEARYGLMDAIKYCAENGINPIEEHFNIYFTDRNLLKDRDVLYADGTFSHEYSKDKEVVGIICLMETSEYEKSQGWTHGYIIPEKTPVSSSSYGKINSRDIFKWSISCEDLPFPHTHFTNDDLNHWDEIEKIESEHFIQIDDYDNFPAFKAVKDFQIPIPMCGTSPWFLPSVFHAKRFLNSGNSLAAYTRVKFYHCWTSSQANKNNALVLDLSGLLVGCTMHNKNQYAGVIPFAAF